VRDTFGTMLILPISKNRQTPAHEEIRQIQAPRLGPCADRHKQALMSSDTASQIGQTGKSVSLEFRGCAGRPRLTGKPLRLAGRQT
jgi:hypothetical protein